MSESWWDRALLSFPGGVNSPVRSFKHIGRAPIYFERAEGPFLYSGERRFIDFCMGFGPHILGHSPACVVEAVSKQLRHGTSFGTCHPIEVELAEQIQQSYPGKVRFVNSGTEAVMTALRVARAVTGRTKILKFEGCYHGHFDGLLVGAGSGVADLPQATSAGIPDAIVGTTIVARLDDPRSLSRAFQCHGDTLSAVIVEPVPANDGLFLPPNETLQRLFELARKYGCLVIFDEIITGYRIGLRGACGESESRPDLVTLGKVIGGGLPLAALVGSTPLMDNLAPVGDTYQAGTFSGNILSVTAGLAVIRQLHESSPYDELSSRTRRFADGLSAILSPKGAEVRSVASMVWFCFGKTETFPPELGPESRAHFARFYRGCLDQGIYFPPSPYEVSFLSTAHTERVLAEALERIAEAAKAL